MTDDPTDPLAPLKALHREVDVQAARVAAHHGKRLACARGCSSCCVDDLTVFELEAELIRARHAALLDEADAAPAGGCAFLDSAGACRIYESRPYVCRTQGLPLRWFEEDEESGDIDEYRDICPINLEGPSLRALADEELWLLGPWEERLMQLAVEVLGHERRVSLRGLFRRPSGA